MARMRRLVWLLLLLVLACGAGGGRASVVRAGTPVLTAEAGGAWIGAGQLAVGESLEAWRGEPVMTRMSFSKWDAIDGGKKGNIIMIAPRDEIATREKLEFEAKQQINELEPLQSEQFSLNYHRADSVYMTGLPVHRRQSLTRRIVRLRDSVHIQ